MLRKRIIQVLTLFMFVGFISLFLAYRSGRLNHFLYSNTNGLQSSPNGGPVSRNNNWVKADTLKPTRMSSSKSMVAIETFPVNKQDSTRKLKGSTQQSLKLSERKFGDSSYYRYKKDRLSSSKSAIIFKVPDTIKTK